eukprot:8105-Prymnesium_polylepis.1
MAGPQRDPAHPAWWCMAPPPPPPSSRRLGATVRSRTDGEGVQGWRDALGVFGGLPRRRSRSKAMWGCRPVSARHNACVAGIEGRTTLEGLRAAAKGKPPPPPAECAARR